jgi:hypothetical protein
LTIVFAILKEIIGKFFNFLLQRSLKSPKLYAMFRKSILSAAVTLFAFQFLYAQQPRPVPVMWVSKQNSQDRITNFGTGSYTVGGPSKEKILNAIVKGSQPVNYTYPKSSLDKLIDLMNADLPTGQGKGLRVYLAAFDPQKAPASGVMGATADMQLVLIFAPAVSNFKPDAGTYYIISPRDSKVYSIGVDTQQDWVQRYFNLEDNVAGGLASTIKTGVKENRIPAPAGTDIYSDTRCIYYDSAQFVDFIKTERHYQDTNSITNPSHISIDSIEIEFAAYPKGGVGANPNQYPIDSYQNRLVIFFDFRRNGQLFYIDDAGDFCPRPKPYATFDGKRVAVTSGDNGQLCPPNCPCPPYCP